MTPSDGGYWPIGCVAAVNWHNGQIAWSKKLSPTNKADRIYDGVLYGGYLYVCGQHSGLHYNNTKKTFSNGLAAKISLSGELVAYKTFGDPERSTGFYNLAKDSNGSVICAGYSGENLGNDNTKWSGWFLKTDMSSNGSSKATPEIMQDVDDEKLIEMEDGINTAPKDGEMRYDGM